MGFNSAFKGLSKRSPFLSNHPLSLTDPVSSTTDMAMLMQNHVQQQPYQLPAKF
jgi:hypothetical protein